MERRESAGPWAVSISPLVRDLRRQLGALAWVVFEDVALDAEATPAGFRAATSARRVAAHVGITPGTAASALRKLRDHGLLLHCRLAGAEGRFGLSVYEVVAPEGLEIVPCVEPPNTATPHVVERLGANRPGRREAIEPRPFPRAPVRRSAQEAPQLRLIGLSDDEPE